MPVLSSLVLAWSLKTSFSAVTPLSWGAQIEGTRTGCYCAKKKKEEEKKKTAEERRGEEETSSNNAE